ncbi:DUF421 domain-containing protein [Bacillus cereus]|uniref:DUF421 domain-containing protein n=1 Tax=Bacillus cereus TaxID=1396 RepID=UPI00397FF805
MWNFFFEREHLSILEWGLRSVIAYFFLLAVAKFMGQRSISQLRFLDFITALILGNILAHPLSDEKLGMIGSMTTTAVLIILYSLTAFLSLSWESWRRFLEPDPLILIQNGNIVLKNLKKARISIDYLLSELRMQKIEDITKVAVALWEPGGNISSFLKQENEPVTKKEAMIEAQPFSMPFVVMKEGKINEEALALFGRTEKWLQEKLQEQDTYTKAVLVTLDQNEKLCFILEK